MSKLDNNKLIAEFMNITKLESYYLYPLLLPQFKDTDHARWCSQLETSFNDVFWEISINNIEYHSSWDWLMPVVRKIVEICCEDGGDLFLSDEYTSVLETVPLAIIEDSHKVVVEFINFYNQNK